MPKRWMVAGCLMLATRISGAAGDPDGQTVTLYAPGIPAAAQEIPILAGTGQAVNTANHFSVTINPLTTQRAPDAAGALADSADENVDFGWRLPLSSMFTVGYDTAVDAFRQDQTIWDDEEATSQVTSGLINKASLGVQPAAAVQWTGYVQGERSLTDGQPAYSDATKYGTEADWTPVKDVTKLSVQASKQQTINFDNSVLDENLYTASVDQKLPYIPVTLHTAGSLTDDTAPLLAADDKDNAIVNASLLWKIVASTSLTGGVQRQDTTIPAAVELQDTDVYFTQVDLQASRSWGVSLRAAHQTWAGSAAGQFLPNSSDDVLSLGLTWKLGDRFSAGAGVNYRVLQSQMPASAASTPPATVSVSAGGNF